MNKDKKDLGLKVNVVIKTIDRYTGKVKEVEEIHNILVTSGKSRIANLLIGDSSTAFKYLAIGTGTDAPIAGDLTLGTEQKRSLATLSEDPTGTAKWVYLFTFSSGESFNITEIGIFDSLTVSGSTMMNRSTFSAKAVDADTDLSVTVTMACDNA